MTLLSMFMALAAQSSAASGHSASVHIGVPGRCEAQAVGGGGEIGCYLNVSVAAGPLSGEIYWHIDKFADPAAAGASKGEGGTVVTALGGKVFLYTLNGSANWRPGNGVRVATIGPMKAPEGQSLVARYMEATTNAPAKTRVHRHSGPEAFYLQEGAICVETSAGATRIAKGNGNWLPGKLPMQLSNDGGVRKSLLLVLHPVNEPWMTEEAAWKPTGLCSR